MSFRPGSETSIATAFPACEARDIKSTETPAARPKRRCQGTSDRHIQTGMGSGDRFTTPRDDVEISAHLPQANRSRAALNQLIGACGYQFFGRNYQAEPDK